MLVSLSYWQYACSKISCKFFPKWKAIADVTYIHFILLLRNRTIYSLYLNRSLANICTGFISEKKQKPVPCRAIWNWFFDSQILQTFHFKKSEKELCCTEWAIRLAEMLPFTFCPSFEYWKRKRISYKTFLFSFSLFCFCL